MWQMPMHGDDGLPFALPEDNGILLGFGTKFTQVTKIGCMKFLRINRPSRLEYLKSYSVFVS